MVGLNTALAIEVIKFAQMATAISYLRCGTALRGLRLMDHLLEMQGFPDSKLNLCESKKFVEMTLVSLPEVVSATCSV